MLLKGYLTLLDSYYSHYYGTKWPLIADMSSTHSLTDRIDYVKDVQSFDRSQVDAQITDQWRRRIKG